MIVTWIYRGLYCLGVSRPQIPWDPGDEWMNTAATRSIVYKCPTSFFQLIVNKIGGSRPSDSFLSRSEGLDHAEGVYTLHGCVRWSPVWRIRAWRAWRLPGRWPDGGRRSTDARWTRRRAAPAYAPIECMKNKTTREKDHHYWNKRYDVSLTLWASSGNND